MGPDPFFVSVLGRRRVGRAERGRAGRRRAAAGLVPRAVVGRRCSADRERVLPSIARPAAFGDIPPASGDPGGDHCGRCLAERLSTSNWCGGALSPLATDALLLGDWRDNGTDTLPSGEIVTAAGGSDSLGEPGSWANRNSRGERFDSVRPDLEVIFRSRSVPSAASCSGDRASPALPLCFGLIAIRCTILGRGSFMAAKTDCMITCFAAVGSSRAPPPADAAAVEFTTISTGPSC